MIRLVFVVLCLVRAVSGGKLKVKSRKAEYDTNFMIQ
jgi:hypothetical protein